MNTEIPEPWASRMIDRGFTDPRYKHDVASMSALAASVGLHTSTISGTIRGKRAAKAETVNALVAALGDDVAGWLGAEHHGAWQPPAASALLTPRQRKALNELILSMTSERGEGHAGPAPMTSDDGAPGGLSVVDDRYADRAAYDPESGRPRDK